MRTLLVLLDKEFRQLIRHSFLPRMVVVFPVMIMFVMPWVATMDVRHINIAVVDQDRSSLSARVVQKVEASDYFTCVEVSEAYPQALARLEAGEVDVIVELPDGFERSLGGDTPEKLRITANGVNALKGSLGAQYTAQTVWQTLSEWTAGQGGEMPGEALVIENRYNPTLEYRNYMIPALMIMLLILLCGSLPALNLVGEKEAGTIEQINATPVGRFTFTLAKLIPYWIIGLVVLSLSMLLGWWVYGLVPVGTLGAIYLAAILFILAVSGLGVIVANHSATMQQAMFVQFFFIMVFVLMSGLITPIASMPSWAQVITYFLPPRYFIDIMQAVYLKGTTILELWPRYAALATFALVLDTVAAITYKKQV